MSFGFFGARGRSNERALRAMVDATLRTQAVLELDLDGVVLEANDNFLALMGYTSEQVMGRHHAMFMDPALSNEAEQAEFWAGLRSGRAFTGEVRRLAAGGREVWLQASYMPLLDERGAPMKVVMLATDSTGTRRDRRSMSAIVKFTSPSCAAARRCSTVLVEPPMAMSSVMAFSKASKLAIERGSTEASSCS